MMRIVIHPRVLGFNHRNRLALAVGRDTDRGISGVSKTDSQFEFSHYYLNLDNVIDVVPFGFGQFKKTGLKRIEGDNQFHDSGPGFSK